MTQDRAAASVSRNVIDELVPAFALQTLVENAVRDGAAPGVAPTEVVIEGSGTASEVRMSVRNRSEGGLASSERSGPGTGLARLGERPLNYMVVRHGWSVARMERAGSLPC